ncbi:MAG: nucleoside-diphosphate kinase [Elusimicrobia bacterium RIFCSPHIGHO2_02_FULL_57_9]|nr:MAG: nucleoside-diphosphate kinase [Elusimicrobia bacterium RIFCSPHIGHO2_02_FULL_57_9]
MAVEQTLILIKPDGLSRKLTGLTIDRLDASGLEMVGAKMVSVSEKLAREHYKALCDKPFFSNLIKYIRGDFHGFPGHRVLAMVYRGEGAIAKVRQIAGATNPEQAEPGTIRGSFGRITTAGQFENVIHASSDPRDAEREIRLWFKADEILPEPAKALK